MSQSMILWVYLILSIYAIHVAARMVEDTTCGSATLRGPLSEDGLVEQILRVEADLYSEDPIVIRCQLNLTADPSVDYNLRLKIHFTSLDEEDPDIFLKESDSIFESVFRLYPKPLGNIIYYNVSINASARLDRSIIACGANIGTSQHCYTTSTAVIIFRDYDPCNHPTATPVTTPTTSPINSSISTTKWATASIVTTPITPPINSSTSTTKWATASTVTTPITPPTNSSTSESPTMKSDPTSIPTPTFQLSTALFSVSGTAILVGIVLLVANVIQLWVIITMRKRRAAAKIQISATNDVALEQHGIELDHGLESEEDTTIQNNYT